MDELLENKILDHIRIKVNELGRCSIKEAADKFFCYNISLSEQKRLAKLIVKSHSFVTEKKNGEIIVKQNNSYKGEGNSENNFGFMEGISAVIIALLSYLVFDLFLKNL